MKEGRELGPGREGASEGGLSARDSLLPDPTGSTEGSTDRVPP